MCANSSPHGSCASRWTRAMDERLARLAPLHGLAPSHPDGLGHECHADAAPVGAGLGARGVAADSSPASEAALRGGLDAEPRSLLPPVRVVFEDEARWSIDIAPGDGLRRGPLSWQIETEYGELRQAELSAAELQPSAD